MRNVYSCSIKTCTLGFNKLVESIFYLLLVVEEFSLQIVSRCLKATVVLEKTLESTLDWKEIQPVHPEDQSWVFIGRTDAEAETPILWPTDVKSWPIWKYPDAGKDWGQEEKGTTEDEMVGRHHRLNGHEFG